MATTTTRIDFDEGAAPATPAAADVRIYAKADGLMYSKDDAGVETLMSGGAGGGSVATDAIWDAKGDLAGGTGANTAAKLTVGANGRIPVAASGEATGIKWAGGLYFSRRVLATVPNTSETMAFNSATYVAPAVLEFYHDWDFFPATHFLISAFGVANEAAQTVKFQLAQQASPTDPVSAAGDDLTITDAQSRFSSGWIAVSDVITGIVSMVLAAKGSNATVDFAGRWLDIAFKIA